MEKIKISNFRSINNETFDLSNQLLVFIGENNAGKSTVLNAIRIFNDESYEPSFNDIRHGQQNFEISIIRSFSDKFIDEIYQEFKNSDLYSKFLEKFNKGYIKERETGTIVYKKTFKKYIIDTYFSGVNYQKLGIKLKVGIKEGEIQKRYSFINSSFREIGIEVGTHNSFFLDAFRYEIADIEEERKFFEEVDGQSNTITNSVFNLFVESIDNSNTFNLNEIGEKRAEELTLPELNTLMTKKIEDVSKIFLEKINEKFNNYLDTDLSVDWVFDKSLRTKLRLETQFKKTNANNIDFMSSGSGTRSLYLLSLLESYVEEVRETNKKSVLFLIEEPELYLYPKLESEMGLILKRISEKHKVIITSHSSGLIKQFNNENIYVVENNKDSNLISSFSKLRNAHEAIEMFGFNSHPIANKKYIFMVEGIDDIKSYRKIVEFHFRKYIDECGFIKVNSFKNIEAGITTQFIKNTNLINTLFIITDKDGRDVTKIKNQYKSIFENVLSKQMIDDLFENRLYVTENSMNLDCLSITIDNIYEKDINLFAVKVDKFIAKNSKEIENEIEKKSNKKFLRSIEHQNKIRDNLYSDDLERKLETLKSEVLNKNLLKKYKNEVYIHDSICSKDKEYQERMLPELIGKLSKYFEVK